MAFSADSPGAGTCRANSATRSGFIAVTA